jgi:hypothetical protein
MWALNGNRKKRHFWGFAQSLCGEIQMTRLDYAGGVGVKKCQICQKLLGRRPNEISKRDPSDKKTSCATAPNIGCA